MLIDLLDMGSKLEHDKRLEKEKIEHQKQADKEWRERRLKELALVKKNSTNMYSSIDSKQSNSKSPERDEAEINVSLEPVDEKSNMSYT